MTEVRAPVVFPPMCWKRVSVLPKEEGAFVFHPPLPHHHHLLLLPIHTLLPLPLLVHGKPQEKRRKRKWRRRRTREAPYKGEAVVVVAGPPH